MLINIVCSQRKLRFLIKANLIALSHEDLASCLQGVIRTGQQKGERMLLHHIPTNAQPSAINVQTARMAFLVQLPVPPSVFLHSWLSLS